jgi:phospholipid/cholesterol/gamma-HCH transport system permease protein
MASRHEGMLEHIGAASLKLVKDIIGMFAFARDVGAALYDSVKHPRRIRWRETLYYMDMCGGDALPITALICFLMGVILGYQAALQAHKNGLDNFLAGLVGCSFTRELGPLMVAVIATGRAGSAFAAEIGTMKLSEEVDAMKTMGFVPERFLVIPKLIAMLTMVPLLTVIGDVVGIVGGMLVANVQLDIPFITYYNQTVYWVLPRYFAEGLIKSVVYALIITCVGCMRGFETGNDAIAVGRSTTSAVVTSIFLIIVADTGLTMIFNTIFFK